MIERKTLSMVTDRMSRRLADSDHRGEAPPRDPLGQVVRIALAIYLAPVFLAVTLVGAVAIVFSALTRGAERLASGLSARIRL